MKSPPIDAIGWHADPEYPGLFWYWTGRTWDCAAIKRPNDMNLTLKPNTDLEHRISWLELDGWVDVTKSTVPGVVSGSGERNWYGFYVSPPERDLIVRRGEHPRLHGSSLRTGDSMKWADGTYSLDFEWASRTVRRRPDWAVFWGILLCLVFLLGLLLFLIKEDQDEHFRLLTVTLADGTSFSGEYVQTTCEPIRDYWGYRTQRGGKDWGALPER